MVTNLESDFFFFKKKKYKLRHQFRVVCIYSVDNLKCQLAQLASLTLHGFQQLIQSSGITDLQ